jgi:hypothetical protein
LPYPLGYEGVAALLGTVLALAEPVAPLSDETKAAIAFRILAFHDTCLARFFMAIACPAKHCVSQ